MVNLCELSKVLAHRAVYVADEFDRARGPDVAYHASHALHSLAKNAASPANKIRPDKAEMIRQSIEAASPHLLTLFPDVVDRSRATLALSNAKNVAAVWLKAALRRASSEGASLLNEIRHVEWLRNCCHNLALLDDIEAYHTARAQKARRGPTRTLYGRRTTLRWHTPAPRYPSIRGHRAMAIQLNRFNELALGRPLREGLE